MENIAILRVQNTITGNPRYQIYNVFDGILSPTKDKNNKNIFVVSYLTETEVLKLAVEKIQKLFKE